MAASMILRAHRFVLLAILLGACAPKTVNPPAAEPEQGPTEGAPQAAAAAEPEPLPPLSPTPEMPSGPVVWDKEIERAALPGGLGTIVLGASACDSGQRALLLKREKSGVEPLLAELAYVTGCDFTRDGKVWITTAPTDDEARSIRLQLGMVALGRGTVAVVLDIQEEGGNDPLVLARADSLALVETGRLSDSSTDLFISQGQLTRVLRSDGSRAFMWHEAHAITVGSDGQLAEKPRAISMARTKTFDDWKEAAPAKDALVASCPKSAGRIALLEVFADDGTGEYWLGIPTLSAADANTAVRELKTCGQTASVATRPPSKAP
jgi:hypothetical protein